MSKYSKSRNPYYAGKIEEQEQQADDKFSQHSASSNKSARQLLFQRANMQLIESRLSNKSISESKLKYSRNRSGLSNQSIKYKVNKSNDFEYPKTSHSKIHYSQESNSGMNQSRNKLLNDIAQKLKNRQTIIYDRPQNYIQNPYSSNKRRQNRSLSHRKQSGWKYRADKKQKIDSVAQDKKTIRTKLSKLQNLLKNIKKSNRQALQVAIHTENSNIQQQNKYTSNITSNLPINNYSNQKNNGVNHTFKNIEHIQPRKKQYKQPEQLKLLSQQLRIVREQLRQVKLKNQQLLSVSHSQSNLDNMSQASDLIPKNNNMNNFRIDQNPYYHPHNQQISMKKPKQPLSAGKNQYTGNFMVRQCFACGCTCRFDKKNHNYGQYNK